MVNFGCDHLQFTRMKEILTTVVPKNFERLAEPFLQLSRRRKLWIGSQPRHPLEQHKDGLRLQTHGILIERLLGMLAAFRHTQVVLRVHCGQGLHSDGQHGRGSRYAKSRKPVERGIHSELSLIWPQRPSWPLLQTWTATNPATKKGNSKFLKERWLQTYIIALLRRWL